MVTGPFDFAQRSPDPSLVIPTPNKIALINLLGISLLKILLYQIL